MFVVEALISCFNDMNAEYGWGEKPSVAGDVYSFGILLLQLFSGKSPTDDSFTGGLSLTKWVQSAISDKIVKVIDPQLLSLICESELSEGPNPQLDCVTEVLGIGLSCTTDFADGRLHMKDVVGKIQAVRDTLLKVTESNSPSLPSIH